MESVTFLQDERLPAAFVDLDAFDRNAAHVAELAGGLPVRVATKSLRVPALIRRALDSSAAYRGLMCFAVEEAVFLHGEGFDDLLIAYPTVQPSDLSALRALHDAGADVKLMVDCGAHLEVLDAAMGGCDRPFPVVLDVDMSLRPGGGLHLGVRRSPVRSLDEAVGLFRRAAGLVHVRMVGLMGYEAQVAGLVDRNPFKRALNPVARWIRRRSIRDVAIRRERLAATLDGEGFEIELFNGGGSGSLDSTPAEPWLTEVTAGSALLCSHLFDYYRDVRFEPACFFALQVVRSSDGGYATCLGGGYVASGEPGWDKVPVIHHPAGAELITTEGCGEVQTPLRLPAGVTLEPGQPAVFRHAKAGELAERFDEYLLVSGGEVVDRVPTYRGLGRCFF